MAEKNRRDCREAKMKERNAFSEREGEKGRERVRKRGTGRECKKERVR